MENLQMISFCLLLGIIFLVIVCVLVIILAKVKYQIVIANKKIEILPTKESPNTKHGRKGR